MDYSTGKLAFIFIVAVMLSCAGAWGLAHRYRAAMRRLMSAPAAAAPGTARVEIERRVEVTANPPPLPVTAQDNRRADLRLALLLIALSGLMALSSAALFLVFSIEGPFSFKRLAVLALVHAWPVIPALGLMWRWPRVRLLAVLVLWCVLCFAVLWWRSTPAQPFGLLIFLAGEVGVPMLLVALLCLGDATRAIAAWLLPPLIGLVWASVFGVDLLALLVARESPWLLSLPAWLGAGTVMVIAVALAQVLEIVVEVTHGAPRVAWVWSSPFIRSIHRAKIQLCAVPMGWVSVSVHPARRNAVGNHKGRGTPLVRVALLLAGVARAAGAVRHACGHNTRADQ